MFLENPGSVGVQKRMVFLALYAFLAAEWAEERDKMESPIRAGNLRRESGLEARKQCLVYNRTLSITPHMSTWILSCKCLLTDSYLLG